MHLRRPHGMALARPCITANLGRISVAVARLLEAVERLEHFPRSGRIVPELSDPQLREIIESPYRVRDETVEILTVFRASRLLPSALGD